VTAIDRQAVKTRTEKAARKIIWANHRKHEGKLKGQFIDYTDDPAYREGEALEQEAAELMVPLTTPEIRMGEVLPESQTDTALAVRSTLEDPDQAAVDASVGRTNLLLSDSLDVMALGLDAANSINAQNSLEKMLAHQMTAAHKASFRMLDKSMAMLDRASTWRNPQSQQTATVESARLMNAASRMMVTFQKGLQTLQKIRTGGNQTMTVQHVHLEEGAQAHFGPVKTGGNAEGGSKNGR
jgi:hypothetical protein